MFNQTVTKNSVFRQETCLSTSYTPGNAVGRDRELSQIADALRPLTRNSPPENLFLYGPAGAGKTTCVQHVLDHLETQASIKTVYINCWRDRTFPSLLSQLLNALDEVRYMTPRKGMAADQLLANLQEWLEKNDSLVVVLDEFDQVEDPAEVVYNLHQCSETADTPLGLILVSNKPPEELELDPRSASRLRYRAVKFQPYNQEDLVDILQERANTAFKPGAVSEDALNLITERVTEQGGDCRHAIELLHRSGRIADREGNSNVTTLHVEQSFNPARD